MVFHYNIYIESLSLTYRSHPSSSCWCCRWSLCEGWGFLGYRWCCKILSAVGQIHETRVERVWWLMWLVRLGIVRETRYPAWCAWPSLLLCCEQFWCRKKDEVNTVKKLFITKQQRRPNPSWQVYWDSKFISIYSSIKHNNIIL